LAAEHAAGPPPRLAVALQITAAFCSACATMTARWGEAGIESAQRAGCPFPEAVNRLNLAVARWRLETS